MVLSFDGGSGLRFLVVFELSDSCGFFDMGRFLRREDDAVVYNFY
jgi:hypothetical protein